MSYLFPQTSHVPPFSEVETLHLHSPISYIVSTISGIVGWTAGGAGDSASIPIVIHPTSDGCSGSGPFSTFLWHVLCGKSLHRPDIAMLEGCIHSFPHWEQCSIPAAFRAA